MWKLMAWAEPRFEVSSRISVTEWQFTQKFSSQKSSQQELTHPTSHSTTSISSPRVNTMSQWEMWRVSGASKENLRMSMEKTTWGFISSTYCPKLRTWKFPCQEYSPTRIWVSCSWKDPLNWFFNTNFLFQIVSPMISSTSHGELSISKCSRKRESSGSRFCWMSSTKFSLKFLSEDFSSNKMSCNKISKLSSLRKIYFVEFLVTANFKNC